MGHAAPTCTRSSEQEPGKAGFIMWDKQHSNPCAPGRLPRPAPGFGASTAHKAGATSEAVLVVAMAGKSRSCAGSAGGGHGTAIQLLFPSKRGRMAGKMSSIGSRAQAALRVTAWQQRHGAAEAIVTFFSSFLPKKCFSCIWQQSLRFSRVLAMATSSPLQRHGAERSQQPPPPRLDSPRAPQAIQDFSHCPEAPPDMGFSCFSCSLSCAPHLKRSPPPCKSLFHAGTEGRRTRTPTPALHSRLPFHQHPSSKNTRLPF